MDLELSVILELISKQKRNLSIMDSNFITATRTKDLVKQRQKVDSDICRQYQRWLITEISKISMGNRDANLTVVDKIKSCMKDVKLRVIVFERSTHGRGYRIYCDVSERKRFVDMILQIVHNSDYIRKFFEIWEIAYYDGMRHWLLYPLAKKYRKLKSWIRLLENMEESNFYDYGHPL